MGPEAELIAGLLGGTLATATYATKADVRVMINTSPEPFTNSIASITEDVAVIGGLWAALHYPWVFVIALALLVLLLVWLLPKLWRGIKRVFGFILRLFGAAPEPVSATPPPPVPDQWISDGPVASQYRHLRRHHKPIAIPSVVARN